MLDFKYQLFTDQPHLAYLCILGAHHSATWEFHSVDSSPCGPGGQLKLQTLNCLWTLLPLARSRGFVPGQAFLDQAGYTPRRLLTASWLYMLFCLLGLRMGPWVQFICKPFSIKKKTQDAHREKSQLTTEDHQLCNSNQQCPDTN